MRNKGQLTGKTLYNTLITSRFSMAAWRGVPTFSHSLTQWTRPLIEQWTTILRLRSGQAKIKLPLSGSRSRCLTLIISGTPLRKVNILHQASEKILIQIMLWVVAAQAISNSSLSSQMALSILWNRTRIRVRVLRLPSLPLRPKSEIRRLACSVWSMKMVFSILLTRGTIARKWTASISQPLFNPVSKSMT